MRLFLLLTLCLGSLGCAELNSMIGSLPTGGAPSQATISAGLKQALEKGVTSSVRNLGAQGGFSKAAWRIACPQEVQGLSSKLRKIGLGAQVDAFEAKMNEAAEQSMIEAAPIFQQALTAMTWQDAMAILKGDGTPATDFFRRSCTAALRAKFLPIMAQKMDELGAVSQYRQLQARYNALPFVQKVEWTPEAYVADKGITTLMDSIAKVELDIRANPAARSTELLRQVFALQDDAR